MCNFVLDGTSAGQSFRNRTPDRSYRIPRKKRVSATVLQRVVHIIRSEPLERRLASAKSLAKSLAETLGKTSGETLGETFRACQASPQSLGSDYMQGSPQDSLRDSFFHAG